MVMVSFRAGHAQGECLISTDVQADRGPATNQRKSKSTMFAEVKILFSSRKEMAKTTSEGEDARQEKMTQIRDHWSGTN
jgi:hypothetical protein